MLSLSRKLASMRLKQIPEVDRQRNIRKNGRVLERPDPA
jgi:hypothetical protein